MMMMLQDWETESRVGRSTLGKHVRASASVRDDDGAVPRSCRARLLFKRRLQARESQMEATQLDIMPTCTKLPRQQSKIQVHIADHIDRSNYIAPPFSLEATYKLTTYSAKHTYRLFQ